MNVEKYKAEDVGKMFSHYMRLKDKNGNYYQHKNQDIDFELSHLNYNLEKGTPYDNLKEFKKQYIVRNKTTVLVADWVVQVPKDYEGDIVEFFDAVYKILKKKYPYCVSAYCHFDETTPHMHYCFAPIDENGKFNAKAIINKVELQNMHPFIEAELEKVGIKANMLKSETKEIKEMLKELKESGFEVNEELYKEKYLPMRELKKRTLQKLLRDLNEAKETASMEIERIDDYVEQYGKEKNIDQIIEDSTKVSLKRIFEFCVKIIFMLLKDLGVAGTKKYYDKMVEYGFVNKSYEELINEKKGHVNDITL